MSDATKYDLLVASMNETIQGLRGENGRLLHNYSAVKEDYDKRRGSYEARIESMEDVLEEVAEHLERFNKEWDFLGDTQGKLYDRVLTAMGLRRVGRLK